MFDCSGAFTAFLPLISPYIFSLYILRRCQLLLCGNPLQFESNVPSDCLFNLTSANMFYFSHFCAIITCIWLFEAYKYNRWAVVETHSHHMPFIILKGSYHTRSISSWSFEHIQYSNVYKDTNTNQYLIHTLMYL